LLRSPQVLGVGDLHVENYGTWRDAEGRLIWGINDFDEACPLPFTNDLVRLAVSGWLAIDQAHLHLRPPDACDAILEGYLQGLKEGGRPFVLSERNRWLRDVVTSRLRDPKAFWDKLLAWPKASAVPKSVGELLRRSLPTPALTPRVVHRQAGLGSLGRPRFTAVVEWCGGWIAREAKPLVSSAWFWSRGAAKGAPVYYRQILDASVRAADPFLQIQGNWVLRRLSPFCSRIELSDMPRERDATKVLAAMGYELANVHLGTRKAAANVTADLRRRTGNWLRQAAETMTKATRKDWQDWRASG